MHKRIIKKYSPGGVVQNGATSLTPIPPNLESLIKGLDLSQIKLNPVSVGGQNSYVSGNIFSKENLGNTMGTAGQIADALSSFLPTKKEYEGDKGATTVGLDSFYDSASNIAMSINPVVGGIMKVGGFVGDGINALTGGTDGMTTTDAIFGSTLGNLTGIGAINSAFGKKAHTIYKDNEAFATVGSSYGGVNDLVDKALNKSGKKYGLLSRSSRKKANQQIDEAKRQQNLMGEISDDATNAFTRQASMSDINNRRYAFQKLGGFQNSLRVGKEGLKFPSPDQIRRAKDTLRSRKFKDGGKMNVIPEGALHARLHHMDMDGITKKGIPVITEEQGGEIVQHAEIERNEIIFTKEVTEQLEKLYKEGTDAAAIEAGKILAREIIENTIDNTGLLKEVS